MNLQKKLEEKIEEYNNINSELERLSATRAALVGQIQLLQELVQEEKSVASKPKKMRSS